MKRWGKALGLGLAVCLSVLSACPAALAAVEEPEVLTVAFPEAPGLNEVYEDGTYGGCVYGWLEEIAKYTGWKYEFVTGDAGDLMKAIENGACDLMGGMYWFEGYDAYFNYPRYVMGANYNLLICRQDDPRIKGYDTTTLNGSRIGVYKKALGKIERLVKFLDFNNLQCELIYFEDLEDYENCLETGAADLLLGSDIYMKSHYNVAAQFEADPYYIVTAKDRPELCSQLSDAMEAIYAANPNFATDLYNYYFPDRYINSISVTEEERAFLAQSGTLKVAVCRDRFPLYYEQDGEFKGIVPECLELVSQRTGLEFEFVFTDSYQGLLDLAAQGKVDIIGAFRNSDQSSDELGLVKTVSYATLDSLLLRNKESIGKTEGLIMAVPKGRDMKPNDSGDTICYYETYQACMDAVSRGKADYTRMPAAFIEDFYARNYYANIALVADTNMQEELALALTVPVNVPLYSILSKALNNFTDEESAHLLANNTLTLSKSAVTLKTLLYTNPVMVIGICVGIILLISAIVVLFNLNMTRARVMRLKLEKAEETSRAKSDFLSRMSHEIRTPMNAIIGLTNLTRMTGEATPAIEQSLAKIDSSAQFLLSLLNDVLDMSKIDSQKMQLGSAPFDLELLVAQTAGMFDVQTKERGLVLEVVCRLRHSYFVGDKMRLQQVLANLLSNACKFTDQGGTVRFSVEEREDTAQASALHFSIRDTGIGIQQDDLEKIFRAFEQAKDSNLHAPGTGLGLAISSSLVELMGGTIGVDSQLGAGSEFHFTISLPVFEGELSQYAKQGERPEVRLGGLHILLAEDNDINAEVAMELLKSKNMAVDRAVDGRQAVELFTNSPLGTYDVLLMDINMPEMDGLTATRVIRAMGRRDAGTIPILAMTANTFQEDRDNAAQAGMTGFLSKPFDVQQLYQILLEVTQERWRGSERKVE